MMASARARLMTAVDLTLTVQGDDPDAPIVHEVQGPVKRKKLEFHNLAENVSLWNII